MFVIKIIEHSNNNKKHGEICSLNLACLSSQLILVQKSDGIFTLLFHRSEYRWHCSWHIPTLISHLPIFLLLCFPSHPILDNWTNAPSMQLQTVWVFLLSAVVSSNFCLKLHENCCFHCVVFMVRFLPSEVMTKSGLAMTPVFCRAILIIFPSCTHQSLCSLTSAIFLPAAEWWPWWARAAC